MRTAVAVGVLGILIPAAPAAAQLQGCGFSECPNNEERPPGVVVNNPGGPAEGDVGSTPGDTGGTTSPSTLVVARPANEVPVDEVPAQAAAPERPAGELPFTGGDVAGLTAIGAIAVGTGVVLVRRSRKPVGAES